MVSKKKSQEVKLEKAMDRLDEIARKMEGDDLELEESLKYYSEARSLYASCVSRLSEAEREIQILMADGTLETESATDDLPGDEQ